MYVGTEQAGIFELYRPLMHHVPGSVLSRREERVQNKPRSPEMPVWTGSCPTLLIKHRGKIPNDILILYIDTVPHHPHIVKKEVYVLMKYITSVYSFSKDQTKLHLNEITTLLLIVIILMINRIFRLKLNTFCFFAAWFLLDISFYLNVRFYGGAVNKQMEILWHSLRMHTCRVKFRERDGDKHIDCIHLL